MTVDQAREIAPTVKVLCDIRLSCVLLMLVALLLGTEAGVGTILALLATLPLSFTLLRHWQPAGARLIQGWAFPAVEALVAVQLFVGFGDSGVGAAYLAATLGLLSCGGGVRPMLISLGSFLAVVALAITGVFPGFGDRAARPLWLWSLVVMLLACSIAGLYLRSLLFSRAELVQQRRSAELADASSQERLRLAQDMHDGMSKTLHGCHLLAQSLAKQLARQESQLTPRARELTHSLDVARQESRDLLQELRRQPPGDLVATSRELVRQWAADHPGIQVVQEYPDRPVVVAAQVQRELSRTLGELLENVRRHAQCPLVAVRLQTTDEHAHLEVADTGRGMGEVDLTGLQRSGHFGLVGVHERMARLGGSVEIESGPGGTQVRLSLPLRAPAMQGSVS